MKWIKIDLNNIPEGVVLAANFRQFSFGYKEKLVGYIGECDGILCCEADTELLETATHYIDINKFDVE